MSKGKIGAGQALLLLLLCRMVSLLAAAPLSDRGEIGGGMAVLALGVSFFAELLLFWPGWLLMRRHPGQDFAQALSEEFGRFGMGAAFFLWLVLTVQAGLTAAEFEGFLRTAVYENAPGMVFGVLFLLAAVFGVYAGLEAVARFTTFGGALFLLLAVSLFGSLLPQARVSELYAVPMPAFPVFLGTVWSFVSGGLETVCFFLLLPYVRNMRERAGTGLFLLWKGLYLLFAAALLLLTTCVLGGSGEQRRLYPFYTLAMAAEGTVLTRLDAVHMSVWSVLGLLRCCLMLWGANTALRCALPVPMEGGVLRVLSEHRSVVTAIGALVTLWLLRFEAVYRIVRLFWREGIVMFVVLWLLPRFALTVRFVRRKFGRRKTG